MAKKKGAAVPVVPKKDKNGPIVVPAPKKRLGPEWLLNNRSATFRDRTKYSRKGRRTHGEE